MFLCFPHSVHILTPNPSPSGEGRTSFRACRGICSLTQTLVSVAHLPTVVLSARNTVFAFFTACSPRGFVLAHPYPRVAARCALPGATDIISLRETNTNINHLSQ